METVEKPPPSVATSRETNGAEDLPRELLQLLDLSPNLRNQFPKLCEEMLNPIRSYLAKKKHIGSKERKQLKIYGNRLRVLVPYAPESSIPTV
eukprot:7358442-Pyramimonas_sp.AAC.1